MSIHRSEKMRLPECGSTCGILPMFEATASKAGGQRATVRAASDKTMCVCVFSQLRFLRVARQAHGRGGSAERLLTRHHRGERPPALLPVLVVLELGQPSFHLVPRFKRR